TPHVRRDRLTPAAVSPIHSFGTQLVNFSSPLLAFMASASVNLHHVLAGAPLDCIATTTRTGRGKWHVVTMGAHLVPLQPARMDGRLDRSGTSTATSSFAAG